MRRTPASLFGLAIAVLLLEPFALAQRGGGRGGGRRGDAELLKQFDLDENGWLGREERDAARAFLAENQQNSGRRRRGGGNAAEPPVPGPRIASGDVDQHPGASLYDTGILRTLFIDFEHDDWEDELAAFYHTDVELPATLRADGKTYSNVGIQFRGNSSYFTVSKGQKRSMSVTLDHVEEGQNIEGYRAMTLLNAHVDPTFVRAALYLDMAKDYIPAPKANFVRVVINGESWGIYVNQQRYNKDFLKEAFDTRKGVRFKSSNRSRGGGLSYLGDSPDDYRGSYEIKSADKDESWESIINVARAMSETPPESLEAALEPIFDVDGALRYLALDIVMMSGDGYWLHGSDYNLYADPDGILHLVHHDANETFHPQGGGRRGGPANVDVDPFASMDDPNKAMRQKLLVVPKFRRTYLGYVRDIARDSLDWEKVGPKIEAYRTLIGDAVEADTRKLYSTEEFTNAVFGDGEENPPVSTLKGFIQQRREFLLNHPAIKALDGH